ncbi:MAG: hypothetical protein GX039_01875 [Clostridia bacterium]|nr:hypothetical protein [Clostridia bacterium]
MHLKYPEQAFIAISRVEAAAAKGIVMQLEIHTLMENSLLEVDELIPLWTGAWDAALALTCSGSKLKVSLNYRDNYYYLRFVTNPFPQNAPELTDIANMARRAGMIFNYKADSGEISLCFAGSSSDS